MRPTFDRRLWILLFIIFIQCIATTNQQNIKPQNLNSHQHQQQHKPADTATKWSISAQKSPEEDESYEAPSFLLTTDDNKLIANELQHKQQLQKQQQPNVNTQKCAKNCLQTKSSKAHFALSATVSFTSSAASKAQLRQQQATKTSTTKSKKPSQLPSTAESDDDQSIEASQSYFQTKLSPAKSKKALKKSTKKTMTTTLTSETMQEHQKVHIAHRAQHKEVNAHAHREALIKAHESSKFNADSLLHRSRRETAVERALSSLELNNESASNEELLYERQHHKNTASAQALVESAKAASSLEEDFSYMAPSQNPLPDEQLSRQLSSSSSSNAYFNESSVHDDDVLTLAFESSPPIRPKRTRSTVIQPAAVGVIKPKEPIIIIDDVEEFDSGTDRDRDRFPVLAAVDDKSEDYSHDEPLEPRVLPLRPVLPNPYENEEMTVVYAEQHSEIRLMCEVDLDIASSIWYKNGQVVHAMDRTSRATDYRFIKETNQEAIGALTITNVMLEDDGKWQCEAENSRRYTENARPVKLVVLDRPKSPYLLIDSRRLDAGNSFVPVKENSELNLACVSEGGNPKPKLTWEVLLSPGLDRHAQKVSAEVLELEEVKAEKDKNAVVYKINSGAKSEARLPAVYRAHHNARILCVMEHPTLKIRQNASLLLDVQYTPSFAISRTPGFGYPLREGIEVSLKCDVDSNPQSMPRWQKDDGDTPVPQTGDGFLNFTSIRREHSGWYKCTSRHLNFQYSSIGYYLSVRYDSVDVTSEPDDQDISVAAASHNPNKGQLEVQLGGAVTLQCPQGSLGCWSHLDPQTARLRGLGHGLSTPTGQFSLKDVVYQDAGTYKCIGQSPTNKKKLEVLQTVGVLVKGAPTVSARNATPVAYPGSPLHLAVEFCANPPAYAARWLHHDRVFTPGNQYGATVLAYGVTDLPTPYCKEARLTYISMHERVPRTFYFIVSSKGGVAEAKIEVNFTNRYRINSNAIDDEEEELSAPEEIHFPVFGSAAEAAAKRHGPCLQRTLILLFLMWPLLLLRRTAL